LKSGLIIISDKAPKIECAVRNVSNTGAAVQVSTSIGIPQTFDIVVDGVRRRARSQWRTDSKIGILFEQKQKTPEHYARRFPGHKLNGLSAAER